MSLTEYLSLLASAISEFSQTGAILSSEVSVDFRTEKIGIIKGSVVFFDDSKLFFTEYLDLRYAAEKLSYSFHYQDKTNAPVFRYDNAAHKPTLHYQDHKHARGSIIQSNPPASRDILEEILSITQKGLPE